jgi:hypothetical protein
MNQDHLTAGVAALSGSTALTNVIQHFQNVDPTTATSETWLILAVAAALYQLALSIATRGAGALTANPAPGTTP